MSMPIGFECAIFNFADNMLVAGAITLVLYALRPEKTPPETAAVGRTGGRRVVADLLKARGSLSRSTNSRSCRPRSAGNN